MIMSFNCRQDFVDASKDSITIFFRGAASRPFGPRPTGAPSTPGRLGYMA
ncbi:MAG TPA: hypothetical protein VF300_00525 [Methanothrix sp.]